MAADIIQFPVQTSCSGCTIPGITTAELRQRAKDNYYSACRRQGIDAVSAFDLAEAFAADIERIHGEMQRNIARAAASIEGSR